MERLANVVQQKTIDNEIHGATAMHQKFKKKLVETKKRIDMQKITEENQRILKRIQEVPPAYNHLEWESEAKKRSEIVKGMALYPEYYERLEKEKEKEKLNKDKSLSRMNSMRSLKSSSMGNNSADHNHRNPVSFPKIS